MVTARMTRYGGLTVALLCLSAAPALAQSNDGMLDDIINRYATQASTWSTAISSAATWLFWTLAMISMVWTFGQMALASQKDLAAFFAEFVRFTIFVGFFWWLLENGPGFAMDIVNGLRTIAGNATGHGSALSPSDVVNIGFRIFEQTLDASSIWSPTDSLVGLAISTVVLIVMALVAVNILLLIISAWILAYAGIFFLGFGGSRWTSDIAINYFRTVLGIATQLFTMGLIVGIGTAFVTDYLNSMSPAGSEEMTLTLRDMGVMLVAAITLLFLVNKVPPLVAGIPQGGGAAGAGIGNFGAGAAFGAMMAGAAAVGAAAATAVAGISKAATGGAGALQALQAAFGSADGSPSDGAAAADGSADAGGAGSFGDAAGYAVPGGSISGGGGSTGGGATSGGTTSSNSSTPDGGGAEDNNASGAAGATGGGSAGGAGRVASGLSALGSGLTAMGKARLVSAREGFQERANASFGGRLAATIRDQRAAASAGAAAPSTPTSSGGSIGDAGTQGAFVEDAIDEGEALASNDIPSGTSEAAAQGAFVEDAIDEGEALTANDIPSGASEAAAQGAFVEDAINEGEALAANDIPSGTSEAAAQGAFVEDAIDGEATDYAAEVADFANRKG